MMFIHFIFIYSKPEQLGLGSIFFFIVFLEKQKQSAFGAKVRTNFLLIVKVKEVILYSYLDNAIVKTK